MSMMNMIKKEGLLTIKSIADASILVHARRVYIIQGLYALLKHRVI